MGLFQMFVPAMGVLFSLIQLRRPNKKHFYDFPHFIACEWMFSYKRESKRHHEGDVQHHRKNHHRNRIHYCGINHQPLISSQFLFCL